MRILIESHSTRSEAAGDDLDADTLKKMFRAQARACEILAKDPTPYVHYFIAETGGLLEPHEFQTWRLLHAPPQPYTRERFDDTYNWTVKPFHLMWVANTLVHNCGRAGRDGLDAYCFLTQSEHGDAAYFLTNMSVPSVSQVRIT